MSERTTRVAAHIERHRCAIWLRDRAARIEDQMRREQREYSGLIGFDARYYEAIALRDAADALLREGDGT